MKTIEPYTSEWFSRLEKLNPMQADIARTHLANHPDGKFCSVCGDESDKSYSADHVPILLRLCDSCREIQEGMYHYKLKLVPQTT